MTDTKQKGNRLERKVNQAIHEYARVQELEKIPSQIPEKFNFHDCVVAELSMGENMVIRFDTLGGFIPYTLIHFVSAEVVKQEDHILESTWLYDELYRIDGGYEVHLPFSGVEMAELILRCQDIVVGKV